MTPAAEELHERAHLPPRPPRWVGDLLIGVVVVSSAFAPYPDAELRPANTLVLAAVVLPAVALPFRRRWPAVTLGVVLALHAVAAFQGTLAPGAAFAVAVAMFGYAYRTTRRVSIWVAAAVALIMVLLALPAAGTLIDARSLQMGLLVAFVAAAGDGARSRRAYIAAITERAERAERTREAEASRRVSEERLRIARELHDTLAHQIAVISLNAGVAERSLAAKPERSRESLQAIRSASRTVLGELGDLLRILRADDADLDTGPQPGLARLDELIRRFSEAGLEVGLRVEGSLERVRGATDLAAYRVLQEALTNAHKYGSAGRAHALLEIRENDLRIVVTNPTLPDNTASQKVESPGLGLVGLRERVTLLRGTVEVGPSPGGWRVAACLPLPKEEE